MCPFRPSLLIALAPLGASQDWSTLVPEDLADVAGGAPIEALEDGSLRVGGAAEVQRYHLVFPTELEGISALRIEALPDDALPARGPGRSKSGNFVLSEVQLATRVGRNRRTVELAHASAGFSQVGWPVLAAIDGREDTGWGVSGNIGARAEAVFNLAQPLGKGRRNLELDLFFHHGQLHSIGRLRVSVTSAAGTVTAEGVGGGLSELERGVNAAIDRGVDYLIGLQDLDGSWSDDKAHYPVGATALNAYALVKSGVKPAHQAVRRALAYVDAHPPRKTYEAGCVLMLYAALDHQVVADRAQRVLADLLDWQLGDWGYPGTHGDPSAVHRDLSNTQYGALGLWAASRMGLAVPPEAWRRLATTVLRYQRGDGGFGYTPGAGSTGSMTAAGVGVLALCAEHLDGNLQREVQVGLERGLDWLDLAFQPTDNPGHGTNWLLYYLYGVERVGAFTGREVFHAMDWYAEGARFLVKAQKDEGHWDNHGRLQANTSFALLFLGRATASVTGAAVAHGGGRARVYGADDPGVAVNLRASGDTPLTVWISTFGDELLDGYTWEGERDLGPRVARVEYLTEGGVVLADSRHGGAEWLFTTREPEGAWTVPGAETKSWKPGRSAFGRPDSPQIAVGTAWERETLWLRREVRLDPARLVEPRLEVSFSSSAPARERGPRGELLKLYDEEEGFVALVPEGGAAIAQAAGGASGAHCLEVGAVQRLAAKIPGWGFPIREKPGPGEYRYLRFRWQKAQGGVMLQLAFEGGWGSAQRYHAGPNTVSFEPSLQVSERAPAEWESVTRDLWADHGDGLLTGLALTPMDGVGRFDGLYLSRKRSDLRGEDALRDGVPEWSTEGRSGAPAGEDALVLWINGRRAAALDHETLGFQPWLAGDDLRARLRPGVNHLALRARNGGLGRALDLGLVDDRRLAEVAGRPDRPARQERFGARVEFPRPGTYRVWARVHLIDGVTEGPVVFESPPLEVLIEEAFDPALVEYARDSTRDLLLDGDVTVTASSEYPGWPVGRLVDGRQDLAWLCADGDQAPSFLVTLRRPVRADTLLLSHARVDRADAARSTLPVRVALVLNGKGDPIVAELEPDRLRKGVIALGEPVKIRSFSVQVLDRSPGKDPLKTAVGFAEVELQLRSR